VSKLKEISKNCLLVVGSVFFVFLILEVTVRIIYGNQPIFTHPQVRHILTDYGYKLEPNQSGTYTLDQPVRTNSYGFRGAEWEMPKPEGRIRIMCLGDSLTFGNAVRIEETYPKVLERKLKEINPNIEVISTAVGGWNTFREADFFKNEGKHYEPDIVVIGFYVNDFTSRPQVLRPSLTKEGRWEGRPSWLRWLPYKYIFLLKRSALITYLRDRIGNMITGEYRRDHPTRLLKNEIELKNNKRIHNTYSYLLEIKEICDRRGIPVVLAAIPSINLFWVSRESPDYIKHLKNFCVSNGILFIDLSKGFRDAGETNRFYKYPWDYHLSPAGHELAAEQLYEGLGTILKEREVEPAIVGTT